jgi:phage uncharacterized protein (putative large terminase), C-terminal domain
VANVLDELFAEHAEEAKSKTPVSQSDKDKCRYDFMLFVHTYLWNEAQEEWDRLSEFHYNIANRLQSLVLEHKEEKTHTCYVSNRGSAKSFWASYAFPLWCIAYKHTKNILLVTSTGPLGKAFLRDIIAFIETDDKFIADFGNLVGEKPWNSSQIKCYNGITMSVKGSGMDVRGTKMDGYRPTMIICDEILSEANSSTSEQRHKIEDWVNKVVMPAGEKNCNIFVVGTILNDACLLFRMLTDPQYSAFFTRKYQAVISFSESPLWDEWFDVRVNLEDPNRIDNSDKFYHEHREEMLKGTEVLWNRSDDAYYELIKERIGIGEDAFATEYQNDGVLEENREIKEEWLERAQYNPAELPEIVDAYIGIDAAATAKRKSDDSAITVVGKDSNNQYYVLETWSGKKPIDQVIDQIFLFASQYFDILRSVNVETTVFQVLLKDLIDNRAKSAGIIIPTNGIKPPTNRDKSMKLRSLIIPIRNGWIKFNEPEQKKLMNEMRRFPKAASDNLFDSLWMAMQGVSDTALKKFSFASIDTNGSKKTEASWITKAKQAYKQFGI